jgi:hypothetical protein
VLKMNWVYRLILVERDATHLDYYFSEVNSIAKYGLGQNGGRK